MPRNKSFSRKNNTTMICWSWVSKACPIPHFSKSLQIPMTTKMLLLPLLYEIMQPGLMKTEKYFSTVECLLFHIPSTKPILQPCWLLLPQTRRRVNRVSEWACTGASCKQEYLWKASSHKSLINFPWQLRKFIIDWEGTHILRYQKGIYALPWRVKI